ncbi:putative integrase family protein [Nitrososphaera viennensis EN76]|uniref:Putative integrase family protein n=2 Tax=Nitrososphaera viennensis TaxID=1034015 RepID=A0A060HKX9_9ARCH|nr:putative integrase family protein [Nitrososphaera viennensis EN76]
MLVVQALVRRKSRLRVKGIKVKDRGKIKEAITISIQNGNYTTREIGIDIGKDHSTISRYLTEMEREERWGIKRDANGNIIISLQKQIAQQYQRLDKEPFNQLPSIQKWITYLKSGKIPARRIRYMTNMVHEISDQLKVMPETIVSFGVPIDAAKRKEIAIEYWQHFLAWFNSAYPQMQRTRNITTFRSFLSAHNINFAHGEGKRYGLSTTPEKLGEYKDIMLTPEQIDRINKRLENEGDWLSWSFMNIDLHTGARAFAMASMSWDRIAMSPIFRVEQFEPKIKKGSWYLGSEGKWWVKYPTEECRAIVETAYDRLPKERKFLFFEDAKSDKANALQVAYFMRKMAVRLKKIFSELDISSWLNEKTRMYALGDGLYFTGHPLHLFRHTMAQYYLAATNWSLAYVASLGGWENTEVLNKCYGGIPEHIKAQIAKSVHVKFDKLDLCVAVAAEYTSLISRIR